MLDHIGVAVRDVAASLKLYEAALAPLGIAPVMVVGPDHGPKAVGFGRDGKPSFWLDVGRPIAGNLHIAFVARSRAEVEAFHVAALAAGGRDNGAPGLRPQYHPSYLGAFVLDFDGINIEAVFHGAA